jgi:lipopolysaccharide transport system ATP-binding protein
MSDVMIRVQRLGKSYRIHHESGASYVALRDVIAHSAKNLYARAIGRGGPRRAYDEEFWALRDVSFEVQRGEVIGVIGRNGAGKSTLLKILSRITEPTEGRIELNGRVSSLLEVGTGFHPELTGRENIFLNGSILGMARREVSRKFDEIVAFAEVERFLDMPVKRYSSGMYMRLAFAVAAHMEPEILIVDEVLAVGDAAFQKKCLGRMGEVSKEGRTILFVSHNIGALMSVCDTGLLMEAGRVAQMASIEEVVKSYSAGVAAAWATPLELRRYEGPLRGIVLNEITVNDEPFAGRQSVSPDRPVCVKVKGCAHVALGAFSVGMALTINGVRVLSMHDGPEPIDLGEFESSFTIPAGLLRPGEYWIGVGGHQTGSKDWFFAPDVASVEVIEQWSETFRREDQGLINLCEPGVRTPSNRPHLVTQKASA